jgi:ribosome biogenesis GTPase A
MSINWFPGHMAAAVEKVKEALAAQDMVIEVLDARCPMASRNPLVETLRMHRQRPCLKVLNKSDLADPAATQAWLAYFNAQKNVKAIALSCKKPGEAAKVLTAAKKIAPHRNDNLKPLRMLIMGVPNVGKSTLINALLKRRVAKVGDEPAVTKALQRYELSPTAILTDTPGLMWPRIERPSDGLMLAASHAIGTNAYVESDVAIFLAGLLLECYPQALAARYGFKAASGEDGKIDGVSVIEGIAVRRGYRLKGAGFDFEKAAMTLLIDYRSGALGRVSLETPASRETMTD